MSRSVLPRSPTPGSAVPGSAKGRLGMPQASSMSDAMRCEVIAIEAAKTAVEIIFKKLHTFLIDGGKAVNFSSPCPPHAVLANIPS
jgi:hypothetical protein